MHFALLYFICFIGSLSSVSIKPADDWTYREVELWIRDVVKLPQIAKSMAGDQVDGHQLFEFTLQDINYYTKNPKESAKLIKYINNLKPTLEGASISTTNQFTLPKIKDFWDYQQHYPVRTWILSSSLISAPRLSLCYLMYQETFRNEILSPVVGNENIYNYVFWILAMICPQAVLFHLSIQFFSRNPFVVIAFACIQISNIQSEYGAILSKDLRKKWIYSTIYGPIKGWLGAHLLPSGLQVLFMSIYIIYQFLSGIKTFFGLLFRTSKKKSSEPQSNSFYFNYRGPQQNQM